MKEVKGLTSLSFGAIACNVALLGIIFYNTRFSNKEDIIALLITGFGLIISILYAVQLILMKRFYYRHHTISISAKVFLHICRIIQLLYSLGGAYLLAATVYFSSRGTRLFGSFDYKFMAALGTVLVTVVMNLTIFFKGCRLLKIVRKPFIDEVMASFD